MSKQFKFLDVYAPIFYEDKNYYVISGGRASGKSTNIAAYFVIKLFEPTYFRGVIARYTQRAITNSIYRDITDLINDWNLSQYVEIKGDEIRCKQTDNLIITHSMKLQEGTMTARGKGLSKVTHLLLDEAVECPDENEYQKLIDSFRTKGVERKIFLLFNPTSKNHWIFKRFYTPDGKPNPKWFDTHAFIHSTYLDNQHNLDPTKVKEWELAETQDPEYFAHHILGQWTDIGEGAIFTDWKFETHNPPHDAEILYGLDWGFASDPTAIVVAHKRGRQIWVEELLYLRGLTNEDIVAHLERLNVPKSATIYADSAEPKSIESLRRLGYRNTIPAQKGPDSVRAGINRIKGYTINVNPNSTNFIQEYYNYAYRTGTDRPIDSQNHLMDAFRYAMTGFKQEGSMYAVMGRPKQGVEIL